MTKVYVITEDQRNAAVAALRAQAHDIAGHSQGDGKIFKEHTTEWQVAEKLLSGKGMTLTLLEKRAASTELSDVRAFHEKFAVPMASEPSWLDSEAVAFRYKFMQEELDEFVEAVSQQDLLLAGDALVDLVYVALGTALMMGLPWAKMWAEVQRANMAKERATSAGQSKRGSALDVVKPAGWTPPDHSQFIGSGPWPVFQASAKKGVQLKVLGYLEGESAASDGTTVEGSDLRDALRNLADLPELPQDFKRVVLQVV